MKREKMEQVSDTNQKLEELEQVLYKRATETRRLITPHPYML